MDPKLKVIPSLRPFTTGRFAGRDLQLLRWQPDGSLHFELLVLCAVDKVRAKFLQVPHVRARQRDPNLVHFGGGDLRPGRVIVLVFGDVTHLEMVLLVSGISMRQR